MALAARRQKRTTAVCQMRSHGHRCFSTLLSEEGDPFSYERWPDARNRRTNECGNGRDIATREKQYERDR
jgi:hypothetical protein